MSKNTTDVKTKEVGTEEMQGLIEAIQSMDLDAQKYVLGVVKGLKMAALCQAEREAS